MLELKATVEELREAWLGRLPPPPTNANWFFNTNETYSPDAYRAMLDQNVMALYGHVKGASDEHRLNEPKAGDRVFAYLNGHGVIAVGRVSDEPAFSSGAVFDKRDQTEFHRHVQWQIKVAPATAIAASEVEFPFCWDDVISRFCWDDISTHCR